MQDFSRFVPNVHFEQIPIKNLVSNQEYQRPLSQAQVEKAIEDFDLNQINPVKVSRRDGVNYVFNGQHTIEIVATVSGSRETPVWCMIYDSLDYKNEADIFANQMKHVRPLKPYEIFMANIEAGNAALDGVNSMDMLIGNIAGTIGETSVIAIVIGAIILILKGIIDLRIPGTYIVTFALFIGIFGGFVDGIGFFNVQYMTAELCGGGLMLGAWFMATDYVTSPITKKGQIVYGILLGCLTGLFRLFGGSAEGVSYAIIFSNLLVPLIERVTLPKPFGKGGEK